jgi:ABC-type multidrug transport system ATPase subunit
MPALGTRYAIQTIELTKLFGHLAYVPADVALWPMLTGAETLELLADLGPGIDRPYRDKLVQRLELEIDRRCGTHSRLAAVFSRLLAGLGIVGFVRREIRG